MGSSSPFGTVQTSVSLVHGPYSGVLYSLPVRVRVAS